MIEIELGGNRTWYGHVCRTIENDISQTWHATLFVPRDVAKGHLKEIFSKFVIPNFYRGPGTAFSAEPRVHRLKYGFLFEQYGGLDV